VRPAPPVRGVVSIEVGFKVVNTNTSTLQCASDGAAYTVRGHLVGPRSAFSSTPPSVITVYLHGFVVSETSWIFDDVPGYNHAAEMAERGHVSLTVERIGWDEGRPNGYLTCVGSAADVAHQIVGRLRKGDYKVEAGTPISFGEVVLAGFETGGAIAQVEAYSYKDVAGLVVIGYHNQGVTDGAVGEFVRGSSRCATGGEDAESDSPGGGYVPATADYIREANFHNADPAVAAAVLGRTEKNPCGEFMTLPVEFVTGPSRLSEVDVPVLLLQPDHDSVADPTGAEEQSDHYPPDSDVTFQMLENTGHFPMFERTAPQFRDVLSSWLSKRWGL
jgi:pimeloyl-ACP methyl ester carboxylesterase